MVIPLIKETTFFVVSFTPSLCDCVKIVWSKSFRPTQKTPKLESKKRR